MSTLQMEGKVNIMRQQQPHFRDEGLQCITSIKGTTAELFAELYERTADMEIVISKDGSPQDTNFLQTIGPKVRYSITNVNEKDSGLYTIAAHMKSTNITAKRQIELRVITMNEQWCQKPEFVRRLPIDLNVKIGSRARLLVEIHNNTTQLMVEWLHDGERVQENERYRFLIEDNFYCIDIEAITKKDQGHWVCLARNSMGHVTSGCLLTILIPKTYKAPEFLEELRAKLNDHGTVSLECKVAGVPMPQLNWYKDGKIIRPGDVLALQIQDVSTLGTYLCEAVNCMGKAYSKSPINIEGTRLSIPTGTTPQFLKYLDSTYSIRIGNNLRLMCQIVVPPEPESVKWYNSKGLIPNNNERYQFINDSISGQYIIDVKNTEITDRGEWKCVVQNDTGGIGISICNVKMSIPNHYRVPRFMETLTAVLTQEGLVSFECKVVGSPTPYLRWFKDGQELKPGDVYHLTGTNSLGFYCCIAKNCMGEAKSSTELTIDDICEQLTDEERTQLVRCSQAPRFIQNLKSVEVKINEPFRFTIQISVANPEPQLQWFRADESILGDPQKYQIIRDNLGVSHLDIVRLELVDQGEWKCIATNEFGHSISSCYLRLIVPHHFKRPVFLEPLKAFVSVEGAVNLECKVIGVPQPFLKWYKNGNELKLGDIHQINTGQNGNSCLGLYSCEAKNCMGTAISSASLLNLEQQKTNEDIAPLSLSTIHEERSSQLYDTAVDRSLTASDGVSFSLEGKEVSISLYETPDLTQDQAIQIVEMYAEQLSEHVPSTHIVELPSLRFIKDASTSGNILLEAVIVDVIDDYQEERFFAAEDLRTEADIIDDILSVSEDTPERPPRQKSTSTYTPSNEQDVTVPIETLSDDGDTQKIQYSNLQSIERRTSPPILHRDLQGEEGDGLIIDLEMQRAKIEHLKNEDIRLLNDLSNLLRIVQYQLHQVQDDILIQTSQKSTPCVADQSLDALSSISQHIQKLDEAIVTIQCRTYPIDTSPIEILSNPIFDVQHSLRFIEKCTQVQGKGHTLIQQTCLRILDENTDNLQQVLNNLEMLIAIHKDLDTIQGSGRITPSKISQDVCLVIKDLRGILNRTQEEKLMTGFEELDKSVSITEETSETTQLSNIYIDEDWMQNALKLSTELLCNLDTGQQTLSSNPLLLEVLRQLASLQKDVTTTIHRIRDIPTKPQYSAVDYFIPTLENLNLIILKCSAPESGHKFVLDVLKLLTSFEDHIYPDEKLLNSLELCMVFSILKGRILEVKENITGINVDTTLMATGDIIPVLESTKTAILNITNDDLEILDELQDTAKLALGKYLEIINDPRLLMERTDLTQIDLNVLHEHIIPLEQIEDFVVEIEEIVNVEEKPIWEQLKSSLAVIHQHIVDITNAVIINEEYSLNSVKQSILALENVPIWKKDLSCDDIVSSNSLECFTNTVHNLQSGLEWLIESQIADSSELIKESKDILQILRSVQNMNSSSGKELQELKQKLNTPLYHLLRDINEIERSAEERTLVFETLKRTLITLEKLVENNEYLLEPIQDLIEVVNLEQRNYSITANDFAAIKSMNQLFEQVCKNHPLAEEAFKPIKNAVSEIGEDSHLKYIIRGTNIVLEQAAKQKQYFIESLSTIVSKSKHWETLKTVLTNESVPYESLRLLQEIIETNGNDRAATIKQIRQFKFDNKFVEKIGEELTSALQDDLKNEQNLKYGDKLKSQLIYNMNRIHQDLDNLHTKYPLKASLLMELHNFCVFLENIPLKYEDLSEENLGHFEQIVQFYKNSSLTQWNEEMPQLHLNNDLISQIVQKALNFNTMMKSFVTAQSSFYSINELDMVLTSLQDNLNLVTVVTDDKKMAITELKKTLCCDSSNLRQLFDSSLILNEPEKNAVDAAANSLQHLNRIICSMIDRNQECSPLDIINTAKMKIEHLNSMLVSVPNGDSKLKCNLENLEQSTRNTINLLERIIDRTESKLKLMKNFQKFSDKIQKIQMLKLPQEKLCIIENISKHLKTIMPVLETLSISTDEEEQGVECVTKCCEELDSLFYSVNSSSSVIDGNTQLAENSLLSFRQCLMKLPKTSGIQQLLEPLGNVIVLGEDWLNPSKFVECPQLDDLQSCLQNLQTYILNMSDTNQFSQERNRRVLITEFQRPITALIFITCSTLEDKRSTLTSDDYQVLTYTTRFLKDVYESLIQDLDQFRESLQKQSSLLHTLIASINQESHEKDFIEPLQDMLKTVEKVATTLHQETTISSNQQIKTVECHQFKECVTKDCIEYLNLSTTEEDYTTEKYDELVPRFKIQLDERPLIRTQIQHIMRYGKINECTPPRIAKVKILEKCQMKNIALPNNKQSIIVSCNNEKINNAILRYTMYREKHLINFIAIKPISIQHFSIENIHQPTVSRGILSINSIEDFYVINNGFVMKCEEIFEQSQDLIVNRIDKKSTVSTLYLEKHAAVIVHFNSIRFPTICVSQKDVNKKKGALRSMYEIVTGLVPTISERKILNISPVEIDKKQQGQLTSVKTEEVITTIAQPMPIEKSAQIIIREDEVVDGGNTIKSNENLNVKSDDQMEQKLLDSSNIDTQRQYIKSSSQKNDTKDKATSSDVKSIKEQDIVGNEISWQEDTPPPIFAVSHISKDYVRVEEKKIEELTTLIDEHKEAGRLTDAGKMNMEMKTTTHCTDDIKPRQNEETSNIKSAAIIVPLEEIKPLTTLVEDVKKTNEEDDRSEHLVNKENICMKDSIIERTQKQTIEAISVKDSNIDRQQHITKVEPKIVEIVDAENVSQVDENLTNLKHCIKSSRIIPIQNNDESIREYGKVKPQAVLKDDDNVVMHMDDNLSSKKLPKFSNVLIDHSVPKDGVAALQLEIQGDATVTWYRNGDRLRLSNGEDHRFIKDRNLHTLLIPRVRDDLSGQYRCVAQNVYGRCESAAFIRIAYNSHDGRPAMFLSRPESLLDITSGEDIVVSCRVTGRPRPSVICLKGLKEITHELRALKEIYDDYIRFTLKRARFDDAGTYCLFARNKYGCDRAFFTVRLRNRSRSLSPTIFLSKCGDAYLYKREIIPPAIIGELQATTVGYDWCSLHWNKPIGSVTGYRIDAWKRSGNGARWLHLGVTSLNYYDAFNLEPGAEYQFRVTPRNRYGWGEGTVSRSVSIILPPEFVQPLPQTICVTDSTIKLECVLNTTNDVVIKWYCGTECIQCDNQYYIINESNGKCTLEILSLSMSLRFTCEAENSAGKIATFCLLQVPEKPISSDHIDVATAAAPQFTIHLRDRRVTLNAPVRLTCQVIGNPDPEIIWYRNHSKIQIDDRHQFFNEVKQFYTMEISKAYHEDDGIIYTIEAHNQYGSISCCANLIVDRGISTYQAPKFLSNFVPSLDPIKVYIDDDLRLNGSVDGYPAVGLLWYKDGLRLRSSRRFCTTLSKRGRIEFSLKHLKVEDSGIYECQIINEAGTCSSKFCVQMLSKTGVEPPKFLVKPTSMEVIEGDTVTVSCEISGQPQPEVVWFRDFLKPEYYKDAQSFQKIENSPEYVLMIPNVKLDYTGTYTVYAKNSYGDAKVIISLQIKAPDQNDIVNRIDEFKSLKILTHLKDMKCCDGDSVTFKCCLSSMENVQIQWEKDKKKLPLNEEEFHSFSDGNTLNLRIRKVHSDDSGVYTCRIYNNFGGIVSTSAQLHVEVDSKDALLRTSLFHMNDPMNQSKKLSLSKRITFNSRRPKFYATPKNRVAEIGATVRFQCSITGHPMPTIIWMKDNIVIAETNKLRVTNSEDFHQLEIKNVVLEDSGLYKVVVENFVGRTEAVARLDVVDAHLRIIREKCSTNKKIHSSVYPIAAYRRWTINDTFPLLLRTNPLRFSSTVLSKFLNFLTTLVVGASIIHNKFESVIITFHGQSSVVIYRNNNGATNTISSIPIVLCTFRVYLINYHHNRMEQFKSNMNPVILFGPNNITALVGGRILLKAHYSGDPEPQVQWSKCGVELKNDDRTSIATNDGITRLLLQNANTNDSGKYIITVKNEYGMDRKSTSVSVEGPPDPPSGKPQFSIINKENKLVTVTWNSSPYDGGSMITGYKLEFGLIGSDVWISNTLDENCLSITLDNKLKSGVQYIFRVRAQNIHGWSEPSNESDILHIKDDDLKTMKSGNLFKVDYEIGQELGRGRFGVVYKVVQNEAVFAAKIIRCRNAKDKDSVFEEIRIMNNLQHPKLLRLIDTYEDPREIVMILEYISGGELFERVVADDFTLTERDCVLFMRQICDGVSYMHLQNVVHLDLKPENIMCHTRCSHEIKIIDFGLAQCLNPDKSLRVLFGTPEFIPPEIINYEPISVKSDMWSVGVICYVLLSGLSPFMGNNDAETFANITRAEYDFNDDTFEAISQNAKDLISNLLISRKENRLSAEECLKHPWLDLDISQVTTVLCTTKLKKFIIRRKWQKTGNAIRALGRMTNLSLLANRRNSSPILTADLRVDPVTTSSLIKRCCSQRNPEHTNKGTDQHDKDQVYVTNTTKFHLKNPNSMEINKANSLAAKPKSFLNYTSCSVANTIKKFDNINKEKQTSYELKNMDNNNKSLKTKTNTFTRPHDNDNPSFFHHQAFDCKRENFQRLANFWNTVNR